jgi:radical SAM superfamily enzyme YgiQ (UPF0313 family)
MKATLDRQYDFETGVYRPPSEGGSCSLLLRVTRNCPWNRCAFCAMYKSEKFELRSVDAIKGDIDAIAAIRDDLTRQSWQLGYGGQINREAAVALITETPQLNYHQGFVMVYNWLLSGAETAFLQDANSLIMKTKDLVAVLEYLRQTFPSIKRVTSYARSKTIARKKREELAAIRNAGLDRLHVGLETGDDALLKRIKKGVTAEGHINGGRKALEAGFQLSEYWMPGLGGKDGWETHATETARVLSAINPHYIRSRPYFPIPGTPLHEAITNHQYQLQSAEEQLLELKLLISELDVTSKVCFDHAGNYWKNRRGGLLFSQSYEGYAFPDEKPEVLRLIEEGLAARNRRPAILNL